MGKIQYPRQIKSVEYKLDMVQATFHLSGLPRSMVPVKLKSNNILQSAGPVLKSVEVIETKVS